jgi:hypothetical protein
VRGRACVAVDRYSRNGHRIELHPQSRPVRPLFAATSANVLRTDAIQPIGRRWFHWAYNRPPPIVVGFHAPARLESRFFGKKNKTRY